MCFKKIPVLVVWLTAIFSDATVFGQNNPPYTPKIIPPSPNAASIAKFGDIPVSPYTGTSDVSIPIYTIQAREVTVPITLDYHTGGIRLSEESGWVGLGWALNAGGMISRTINDKDDFIGGYFNSSLIYPMPEAKGRLMPYALYPTQPYLGNWGYEFACNYKVHTEFGDVDYLSAFKQAFTALGTYDFEPDTYSFNLMGRSGKFIIGRDGKIILQKQENLKIEFATNGSSFTITDEKGTKYYFLDKEYTQPATGGASSISSWMLSKIITQKKDSIIFHYNSDNTWSTVIGITHEILRKGVADETPVYSNDPGTSYLNQTLQSIDYDNCEVQFSFDGNRTDLQRGKRLNNVKIYSKDQDGLKYLKEFQLYYSYFNTGLDPLEFTRLRLDSVKEVSGSLSLPPYVFVYNLPPNNQNLSGKHYSSVDHWGYFNGISNAVNGSNLFGFTPPFYGIATLHGVGQLLILPGANREPDASFMQSFSLNKVTYPTGGYTIFDYEPNYYDYANSVAGREGKDYEYVSIQDKIVQAVVRNNGSGNYSGSLDLSDIYMTSSTNSNATLTIAFRAAGSDSLNHYHNGMSFGNINFTFQNNITDITDASLYCSGTMTGNNCSGNVYSSSRQLIISTASTYNWSAHIDPKVSTNGFLDITATITYKTPLFRQQTMLMAGGLRIKAIRDYSANGKLAKKRIYDYTYQQDRDNNGVNETYSYGRLMGYLSYARNEVVTSNSWPTYATSLTRYSSSFSAFTSQSSGNIVGYDQVTEYTIDSASGLDNGKTVYTFYNSSDTTFSYGGYRFPGVLSLPNNLNGLLKSKSLYARGIKGSYKRIGTTDYYYHSANRIIYDAFKWTHYSHAFNSGGRDDPAAPVLCGKDTHGSPITTGCNCPTLVDTAGYQLTTNFYPVISSEVILLDSVTETAIDQNDTTIQIKNTTRNYYDNPKHFQLTRTGVTDSKGNNHVTLIKYPQDYITSGNYTGNTILDSLIGHNMIAEVIEKRDSLFYNGSSNKYITGAQLNKYRALNTNVMSIDKQYQLSLASPVTDFQPFAISSNTTSQDSRYRQMISYDTYDNSYNILQFTIPQQSTNSFIWDYNSKYPVAQIVKANGSDVAYTSFEADGKGNWNNYAGIITTVTSTLYPPTGSKYYNLTTSATLSKTVTTGTTYVISYWSKKGLYTISGGGTPTNTTGKTINGWTYYEEKVTASTTTLTISGTGPIDEVRLYPYDAQMTTYTYDALGNITSTCDLNNRITYYDYDNFERLTIVRDQDRNVLKKICYDYAGQPSACEGITYLSASKSVQFIKNDCSPSYYTGSTVTYTVPAGTYYSEISQADADQKAIDDVNANGQAYADTTGTCSPPPLITVKYTNSTPQSMTIKFTHKPSGTVYTFTLNSNVTIQTSMGQIMQGGPYDVTISPNGGSYLYNYQVYMYMQNNVHQYSYTDMPSICSTCATVSVSNQH